MTYINNTQESHVDAKTGNIGTTNARTTDTKTAHIKTLSGSIDYDFYNRRARNIRSESIVSLVRSIFSTKKKSLVEEITDCDVINLNCSSKENRQFNLSMKAA